MKMVTNQTRQELAKQSTVNLLMQVSKWSSIYDYLIEEGYDIRNQSESEQSEETKSHRSLRDIDTMIMCLFIYTRHVYGKENYTVSSLAKAMSSKDYNERKACEGRIKRTLSSIAGYQIVDFYRDQHQGKRECIRLEGTDLLFNFLETKFYELGDVIDND